MSLPSRVVSEQAGRDAYDEADNGYAADKEAHGGGPLGVRAGAHEAPGTPVGGEGQGLPEQNEAIRF
jgi:hypothetical protein